jgi:NAD+ synthase (glutamine-hydrolysing)
VKICLAQFRTPIASRESLRLHRDAIAVAKAEGAQLVVCPELSLLGYPPRDLLLRRGVAEQCLAMAEELAKDVPDSMLVLAGLPVHATHRPYRNAVALLRGGRIDGFAAKQLLPSYDVFDEDRYFEPGERTTVIEHAGERVAVLLCEDLWQAGDAGSLRRYARDPVADAKAQGATVLAVLSASPFVAGKDAQHERLLVERARASGACIVSVNAVGGQDDLVFDGGSRVVSPDGRVVAACPRFEDSFVTADTAVSAVSSAADTAVSAMSSAADTAVSAMSLTADTAVSASGVIEAGRRSQDLDAERFRAIRRGIRDYFAATRNTKAILGLSGGIDSALVAAIAASALGAENVTALLMPSRYSSIGSIDDAHASARALRLGRVETLPIEPLHGAAESTVAGIFPTDGLAGENLQSRARGLLVMLASNATGALVLTTGNKSEYATGYATLYGDMNGALAPIGDLYKTEVYAMARMLNARFDEFGFAQPPIPAASIDKPPSAELRPNQTDQDSLPPYDLLDAVLRVLVDGEGSVDAAMSASGAPRETVLRIARMLDRAQFKRDQAAIILKLSPRAFGRGRRYPILNDWSW